MNELANVEMVILSNEEGQRIEVIRNVSKVIFLTKLLSYRSKCDFQMGKIFSRLVDCWCFLLFVVVVGKQFQPLKMVDSLTHLV